MSKIYVEMQNAGHTYLKGERAVEALKSATCTIFPGDRIAVMGPSGSGKSTFLHIMGGLDMPTSGCISWPALGPRETLYPNQVGFVFQSQSLVSSLNVIENVKLPLLLMNYDDKKAHNIAMEVLESIALGGIAEKLPDELSGGQLQRAAVARALAARPKLILADEPTGQLDHPTAQNLFDVLLSYIKGSDTALVVATHDPDIAKRMDAAWKIQHGKLEVYR